MNNSECTIQENKLNSTPFYRCKQIEPIKPFVGEKG